MTGRYVVPLRNTRVTSTSLTHMLDLVPPHHFPRHHPSSFRQRVAAPPRSESPGSPGSSVPSELSRDRVWGVESSRVESEQAKGKRGWIEIIPAIVAIGHWA
jgi:hypothetical protein